MSPMQRSCGSSCRALRMIIAPLGERSMVTAGAARFILARRDPASSVMQSILPAPRQIAMLPYTELLVGKSRADAVASHAGKPEEDGMRWWFNLRGDNQRFDLPGDPSQRFPLRMAILFGEPLGQSTSGHCSRPMVAQVDGKQSSGRIGHPRGLPGIAPGQSKVCSR